MSDDHEKKQRRFWRNYALILGGFIAFMLFVVPLLITLEMRYLDWLMRTTR